MVSYCRVCPANNRYGLPPSDLYVYLDCGGSLNFWGGALGGTNLPPCRTAGRVNREMRGLASQGGRPPTPPGPPSSA